METARRLAAITPRGACSDGERRAAVLLRDELRRRGRPARLETAWVRPGWPLLYAALCALGVAGSLLATQWPAIGLGLLVATFLLLAGDVSGRAPVARLVLRRRATVCVVSEPPPRRGTTPAVRLIVTAPLDAGRGGTAYRLARVESRARRALGGHLASPPALLCAALTLLAAIAGARLAGADGDWPGVVALVPTIALVLGAAAYLDIALSPMTPGANAHASAAAAALALTDALDRDPPRNLAVELVLAGADEGGQLGLRSYVRRRRRGARPQELALLALGPCGTGTPRYHVTEGLLFPSRMHPTLLKLASETPGADPIRRQVTGASVGSRTRWPALGMSALDAGDRPGAARTAEDIMSGVEHLSVAGMVATCLSVVRAMDSEI